MTVPTNTTTTTKKGGKAALTDKENLFLELLFDEECKGNFTKAARLAGYKGGGSLQVLKKRLADEIVEISKNYMAMNSGEAAYTLVGMLGDGAKDINAKLKLDAATKLLTMAQQSRGDKEDQAAKPVNGIFILPPKDKKVSVEARADGGIVIDMDAEDA